MGRIGNLREHAHKIFSNLKIGSHQKRIYRKKVVLNFIDSLYAAGNVPPNWYGLTKNNIVSVINYWRENKLIDDTIRMYMAEIRYFLQIIKHDIAEIDNKNLSLARALDIKKAPFNPEYIQKITDKIILIILTLQTEFGLTLSESFRFTPDLHVREKDILLSRDITNNSTDRVIEIYSDEQKKLINLAESIIEMNSNPIKQYGYNSLRERYRHEIKKIKLTPSVNYRYVFAKKRLNYLLKINKKNISQKIILNEMGVSERTLRRYLN